MLSSAYFQHALYSIACLSLSINFVGARRSTEDERARVEAQLSILHTLKERLSREARPGDDDEKEREEVERLMRLARRPGLGRMLAKGTGQEAKEKEVTWGDIFSGKTPKMRMEERGEDVDAEFAELSSWDKDDLEKLKKEFYK